jgi:hypothetical protein
VACAVRYEPVSVLFGKNRVIFSQNRVLRDNDCELPLRPSTFLDFVARKYQGETGRLRRREQRAIPQWNR